ncbi:nitrogen regulation protein NR(II) [Cohnella sp. GCM10027633]|uniref:two-component system sensor histidine kinase NtrB n=1 Tax=unclassified Cohnella TaxID=2636738 RepID=UPI0036455AEA
MADVPEEQERTGDYDPAQTKQAWYMNRFANRFLALDGTGVLVLDSEFRIVEISDMLCERFGCRREDAIERELEKWLVDMRIEPPPFGREHLLGGSFRDRSWTWTSGSRRFAMMLDGDRLEDGGGHVGAFVIFRDVSHQIALEEQIRQSDRLKTIGQIAAGTAHEIRNPLTAMKGFMQLLNKTLAERSMGREQEYVNIVLSEIERVNELVGEFLLLSKPREAKYASVRIGKVVQEILPMISNEALLHNVTVRHEPNVGLPSIVADKELLKQVFLNLGKNAIEAMHGGGTLTIREYGDPKRPDRLAVEVRDTGAGIPAEVLEKVFEPFYTTKQQGTGLGLSICQRIVHDLGGRIEATSDGGGTTFTVWLPCSS